MNSKWFFLVLLSASLGTSFSAHGQTKVILIMKNNGFHYEGLSDRENVQVDTWRDSIVISFSPRSREEYARWTVKRDSAVALANLAPGIVSIDPSGRIIVKDLQNFVLKVRQNTNRDTIVCRSEKNFGKILGYSLLPGGGRFYARHPWQGVALGILQVAPIPLVIYYNDQRLKYLDRARDAARRVDQAALDENFDKSQDFRLRAGIAIGVSAVAYLINTFDVLTGVKEVRFQPLVDANGVRLNVCKKF